jgi:hypothetical protein
MPSRMYSTIQLLEIMRRSAFKSPLSYPFLLGLKHRRKKVIRTMNKVVFALWAQCDVTLKMEQNACLGGRGGGCGRSK